METETLIKDLLIFLEYLREFKGDAGIPVTAKTIAKTIELLKEGSCKC